MEDKKPAFSVIHAKLRNPWLFISTLVSALVYSGVSPAQENVTIGVDNLTGESPPYVSDVALNTSSIYDYLGRFYYIRLKLGFD